MSMGPYSFPTAFPYGAPKPPDYSQPLKEVSELISTIRDIKKQKHETALLSEWMKHLDKQDIAKGDSEKIINEYMTLGKKGDWEQAQSKLAKLSPQPFKSELTKERLAKKPPTPSLAESGWGTTIPGQVAGRGWRILKGAGQGLAETLLPIGKYKGPLTPTEIAINKSRDDYNQWETLEKHLDIMTKTQKLYKEPTTKGKTQTGAETKENEYIQWLTDTVKKGGKGFVPGTKEEIDITNMDIANSVLAKLNVAPSKITEVLKQFNETTVDTGKRKRMGIDWLAGDVEKTTKLKYRNSPETKKTAVTESSPEGQKLINENYKVHSKKGHTLQQVKDALKKQGYLK